MPQTLLLSNGNVVHVAALQKHLQSADIAEARMRFRKALSVLEKPVAARIGVSDEASARPHKIAGQNEAQGDSMYISLAGGNPGVLSIDHYIPVHTYKLLLYVYPAAGRDIFSKAHLTCHTSAWNSFISVGWERKLLHG